MKICRRQSATLPGGRQCSCPSDSGHLHQFSLGRARRKEATKPISKAFRKNGIVFSPHSKMGRGEESALQPVWGISHQLRTELLATGKQRKIRATQTVL